MYSAKIIADSISETGKRLTTFEVTFPRIVLAEFNTHRMFSRNSASSRAIPFSKQIERVKSNPFIPEQFPINCTGMQPQEYVKEGDSDYELCKDDWLAARDAAIDAALNLQYPFDYEESLRRIDSVHKQILNRLLEPFQWHTVIVTATEFDNFFKLRTNEQAQYEIRRIADLMYDLYHDELIMAHQVGILKQGEWHLPFISDEDEEQIINYIESGKDRELYDNWYSGNTIDQRDSILSCKKEISVARCARVSYLTHDGKRDIEKDLELFERLRTSGHWSPFEHVATPYFDIITYKTERPVAVCEHNRLEWTEDKTWINKQSGNFIGWKQYRKEFQDENCTHFRKEL